MAIEPIIPIVASIGVSLAGYVYARFLTAQYDKERKEHRDLSDRSNSSGDHIDVDIRKLANALVAKGGDTKQLNKALNGLEKGKITISVKEISR